MSASSLHAHPHIYAPVYTCTHMYKYMYLYTHTQVHTQIPSHICTCTGMYTHIHVQTCTAPVHTCVNTCTCNTCIHTHPHMHLITHTHDNRKRKVLSPAESCRNSVSLFLTGWESGIPGSSSVTDELFPVAETSSCVVFTWLREEVTHRALPYVLSSHPIHPLELNASRRTHFLIPLPCKLLDRDRPFSYRTTTHGVFLSYCVPLVFHNQADFLSY